MADNQPPSYSPGPSLEEIVASSEERARRQAAAIESGAPVPIDPPRLTIDDFVRAYGAMRADAEFRRYLALFKLNAGPPETSRPALRVIDGGKDG